MSRLPTPGQDSGTWGDILNDFLVVSHNTDGSLKSTSLADAGAASDSSVVHATGNETITGTKTFSNSPIVPSPTANSHAANKAYVDATVSGGAPDATGSIKGIIQLTGDLGGTAANPSVPGLAGKEPAFTAGTTSQYFRGDKSWRSLDKAAVGLGSVDNTSDLDKPVSNATQTALSGKLSTSSVTTKGDLLVASAAGVVNRLGVGTTGQQLVPDSTQPLGMKWSAGTYVQATDYGVVFDGSTDDASALQSAIAAAISANKPLFLPPGIAIVGTSLSISAPISIIGSGREATVLKAKNGLNGYVLSFTGGSPGTGIVGARFSDFTIDGNYANQTSGGGILANGAVQCSFERLHMKGCYNWGLVLGPITGGAFGHHNRVMQCLFDNAGSSAGFGGGLNITSNDENWCVATDFEYLGGSTNPTGSSPIMLYDQCGLNHIISSNFVSGSNGVIAIRIQNANRTRIVGSTFDGIAGDSVWIAGNRCVVSSNYFTGIGNAGSTAVSGIHLEFNANNNVIIGNALETGNASATRSLIRIDSTGGTSNNLVVGNQLVKDSGIAPTVAMLEDNGASTIIRSNVGVADNAAVGLSSAQEAGYLLWSAPSTESGGASTSAPTSGTTYSIRCYVPANCTLTSIVMRVATIGSGLTSGQNLVGVYSAAGAQLGITSDQTTTWAGTPGSKTMALSTPISLTGGTYIYIVVLSVGATPPTFNRTTNSGTENMGLTGAAIRWGVITTSQTALPASFTPANITSSSNSFIACGL